MDNFSKSKDQQLDNQLSEFTDRVLSSDENAAKVKEGINQDELMELQKTVLRLKTAVQTARISDMTNARIRSRLLEEWKNNRQAEPHAPKRFILKWTLPRIAMAGGLAILIIFVIFSITLFTPSAATLTGTADELQVWSPLLILAGIVIIVFLLWHNRHN